MACGQAVVFFSKLGVHFNSLSEPSSLTKNSFMFIFNSRTGCFGPAGVTGLLGTGQNCCTGCNEDLFCQKMVFASSLTSASRVKRCS